MWFSERWQNWKAVLVQYLLIPASAIHLVTTVFLKPGDLLVAPHDCYGGSYRLFDSLAKRGCYRVLFVDQSDEQALRAALAENPKLVLVESPVIHCYASWILRKSAIWQGKSGGERGG